MPEPINDPDEFPDIGIEDYSENELNNKRAAVRYVRKDITAILFKKGFIKTTQILVDLLDISSKGALIAYASKLAVKKNITLRLIFADGRKFTLDATVIHIQDSPGNHYGLKFNQLNNELGDYLLSSQSDLIFK